MYQYLAQVRKQNGISIIMSMVVLTAIIGLVLVSADVAFRITKSGQSISSSEIAFFAAESAAELTIYDIEVNGRGLDLPDLFDQPLAGVAGAIWQRKVRQATSTPGLCNAPVPKPVCTSADGAVDSSNSLMVTLRPDESFQLELNIQGSDVNYPNNLRVNVSGTPGRLLMHSNAGQVAVESVNNYKIPASGILTPTDNYSFRLLNNTGSSQTYEIRAEGNGQLPLGLNIITRGVYQNTERRVEVTRPAWLIY